MMRLALILAALLALAWYFWPANVAYTMETVTTVAPVQTPTQAAAFQVRSYTLTPVADFVVNARLLGKTTYSLDKESELAPIDFALGWLQMANPRILKTIDISQSGRFYYWRTPEYPIPRSDIESQSANMHLIPATDEIEAQLRAMPEGALLRLTGQLVNIREASTGWGWNTSTTRHDTGQGACEVIYVTEVVKGL